MPTNVATGTSVLGWQTLFTTANTGYSVQSFYIDTDVAGLGLSDDIVGIWSHEIKNDWASGAPANSWGQSNWGKILGGGSQAQHPFKEYTGTSSYQGNGAFYRIRVKWKYAGINWRLHVYNTA